MNILILDDQEFRHDGFREAYKDLAVTLFHAYSYNEATQLLDNEVFDYIWLDHDLGTEKDGKDAARYIALLPKEKLPRCVYIHSANWSGAREMKAILNECGMLAGAYNFNDVLTGYLPHLQDR